MPSAVVTVRLPNGETEFRATTGGPPKPGDLMQCRGASWIVARVFEERDSSSIVTLMPAPDPAENSR